MKKDAFVFVACGDTHAARANLALRYLRRFSRRDIIVVKGRTGVAIDCDQVITPRIPSGLDQHQASIFLKTSLHRILGADRRRFCYLDNDVLAVSGDADGVFSHALDPISFAADHCNLRQFSPYAVNCRCTRGGCEHLHSAIRKTFGVKIATKSWQHWNGGVFVFSEASAEFMELWHRNTLDIFRLPYWRTRDQGTLAATVWKLGLQRHPTLPREFNFIVDPYAGISRQKRSPLATLRLPPNTSYSLRSGSRKPRPAFLHFINGGFGTKGWKNWDDLSSLLIAPRRRLLPDKKQAPKKPSRHKAIDLQAGGRLSAENRIVHSLWIGPTLSKLELLTIRSFLRHGHEFHLWVYGDLDTPLPREVILEDANEILPHSKIIKKAEVDPETGVGKGSYSSPFSDLFRFKLLFEKGGYWVDMDVTCLRPFNFAAPYVFRPHRLGVVGNIMKCPPRSSLMKTVYERVARAANEHSDWLMPNRVLSQVVRRLGLTRYIQNGIWNEESWWDAIRPLALGEAQIPSVWFGIHWINEFWRALKESGGFYRGQRLFDTVPDKESPKANSALARLYAEYDTPSSNGVSPTGVKLHWEAPLSRPAARQPVTPQFLVPSHINILLPSLARGGAERTVLETLTGLQRRNSSGKLFVLDQARPSYPFDRTGNIQVYRLGGLEPLEKMRRVAAEVLASPEPVVYTHLAKIELLRPLWAQGIMTIPVIQNARASWQDPASSFNHPNIPFVAAVSEAVARELREDRCRRPVVVIRHELQRWFGAQEQQENRRQIRDRYGMADAALVIGMVGDFKSQKAYTRAIRVLAQVRQRRPAKLVILGGWDRDWGYGRHAFAATHRLALELNVVADLITPGPVPDVEKYYAAFDVFLNTSVHEGLSVALLEAIQAGCPIVAADAGGNREVLPWNAVLVGDSSDVAAYVAGIAQAVQLRERTLVPKPPDFDLVPRIWCLLGRYGRSDLYRPSATYAATLFIADSLSLDGPQRSLINFLCQRRQAGGAWLALLQTVYFPMALDTIERSGTPVISMHDAGDYLERLERILSLIERLNPRNVCFWGVDPRIKLLIAKILPRDAVRLIDVSPGPALFAEMKQIEAFQRRISFSADNYWAVLDHFVADRPNGGPPQIAATGRKVVVISNGVSAPSLTETQLPQLPKGADPDLVIVAVCRIAPGNRVDLLVDLMAELNRLLSGTMLIVVGAVDPRHASHWTQLVERLQASRVTNIHFAGPQAEVAPYLRLAKVFVETSELPAGPGWSLEAMAMGIPVVVNAESVPSGQVLSGRNGFLVRGGDPKAMAHRVRYLLVNRQARARMGEQARVTAEQDFPFELMARRFGKLLGNERRPANRNAIARP